MSDGGVLRARALCIVALLGLGACQDDDPPPDYRELAAVLRARLVSTCTRPPACRASRGSTAR